MDVQATLDERGTRYGDFSDHSLIAQELQDVMRTPFSDNSRGWAKLSPVQRQALTVIADKIARILSGDPNYIDNYRDIEGYARLVRERLERDPNACDTRTVLFYPAREAADNAG